MKQFIDSLEQAITSGNNFGALIIALTLPDICRKIQDPNSTSAKGYTAWFDKWMGHHYVKYMGSPPTKTVFLTGSDAYALRCAMLHQGEFDITDQRARVAIKNFKFIVPPPGWIIHCNSVGDILQLQPDVYCRQVLQAVKDWEKDVSSDPDVKSRISLLGNLIDGTNGNIRV